MPQGERRGTEVDLYDFTYDGRITDHYLSGGLGQLTDGVEGHHNFRLDPDGWGHKGYEWVGWRNDSTERPASDTRFVEILFEFERVRNFTAVRFHANNMFSKDVRVFRRAVLWFSISGVVYREQTSVVFDYMRDTLIEFARNVIITVPNLVARFVKAQLYFDARWLMISEVRFESGKPQFVNFPSLLHFPFLDNCLVRIVSTGPIITLLNVYITIRKKRFRALLSILCVR